MNKRIFLISSLLFVVTFSTLSFSATKTTITRYNSLLKLAKTGDAKAMFLVARMIERGKGTEKDINKASKWYQRSASQNYAAANARLGKLYLEGIAVNKNPKKAFSLLNLAAIQGIPVAQFNLALLYELGIGTDKDLQEAIKWFDQAANGGYFSAKLKSRDLKNLLGINNSTSNTNVPPINQQEIIEPIAASPQATKKIKIADATTAETISNLKLPEKINNKITPEVTALSSSAETATINPIDSDSTEEDDSEELALLSNGFDRDEQLENTNENKVITTQQENVDPIKRQQIKKALRILLTGRWFDKNRPVIFLPSPKAKCNIINQIELKCVSRELQRQTDKETIYYKTLGKISKLNNHGNFIIQYQNTIVRVVIDKNIAEDIPNYKSNIKTGLQNKIHQLNCQYKDKSNLVCIKDNSEKYAFQNRAIINE